MIGWDPEVPLSIVSVESPPVLRIQPPGVALLTSEKTKVPSVMLRSSVMGTWIGPIGARSTAVKLAISLTPLGKGLPNSQAELLLQVVPPAVKVNVLFTAQTELLKLAAAEAAANTTL